MIDYALLRTGQSDLHYIGHSQGTTAFFVMCSLRKEMNAKIRTMHAFGKLKANIREKLTIEMDCISIRSLDKLIS